MTENKKVNLCYFITLQLHTTVNRHRPLILGHIVTHIALYEGLFDFTPNNLHKTCDLLPLHLMSLDDMGLLCKNGVVFSLFPPGPIIP